MSDYLQPTAAVLLPHIGGYAGSFIARKNNGRAWLESLNQPSWRPPPKVFGPVWTLLYSSMGYASYLVWRDGAGFDGAAALPLTWYGVQLALNWAWAPIFFGCRSLRWGLIDTVAMCGCVGGTIYSFYGINKTAAYLMIPYLGWITFASAINFRLWWDNPAGHGKKK